MKNITDVPALIRQIEDLQNQLRDEGKARKVKQKDIHFLFDDVCAAYLIATPEQRVDISVALEYRDTLLEYFLSYFNNLAEQAAKAAKRKRQRNTAHELIQRGIAADALIGRKVIETEMEGGNDKIIHAAEAVDFNVLEQAQQLDVHCKYYFRRALQYQKGNDRIRALKALGIALKLNPKLEENERVVALATQLTGETGPSAIITMSEGYVLKKLVHHLEARDRDRLAASKPKPRSAFGSIRSMFNSETQ
jgi:tetratricopeptide (TPR) repeat protein